MDEKTKTPIECLAALLAEMTERAMKAERERDKANERTDQWYRLYMNMEAKLKETEEALDAAIKDNEALNARIAQYIENIQEGAQDNG